MRNRVLRTMAMSVVGVVGLSGVLAGCGSTETADSAANAAERTTIANARLAEAAGDAEVLVVAMHADWCGTCKALGPQVKEAMGRLSDAPIKFVKADLTEKTNPVGQQALIDMGLEDLYARNGGKTGVLYLVDAQTGAVIQRLAGVNDDKVIEAAVRAAVATAS